MSKDRIRIGSRGSKLAMWQATWARDNLRRVHENLEVEIIVVKTKGDVIQDVALSKLPGKAFFTKEIEDALQRKEIDLAVHSGKDLPTELPDGLLLAGFSKRHPPLDILVSRTRERLLDLPKGARIGTSSIRRRALVKNLRPDLEILDLRGNVDTRLAKLDRGDYEAIVLAAAGIERLGLGDRITERLDTSTFPPAVSQGALAFEIRAEDKALNTSLAPLIDTDTTRALEAERALLQELEGGCQVPLGALARIDGDRLTLAASLIAPDGSIRIDDSIEVNPRAAAQAGKDLAQKLISQGGRKILDMARE